MKRHESRYFFREGVRGIFLHGFMSFAAVGVIVACLLIMGSFALVAFNLDHIIAGIQSETEVLVFVDERFSENEARAIKPQIDALSNVAESTFVTKDEALEEFSRNVDAEYSETISTLKGKNPLRDRYVVRLRSIEELDQTVTLLEETKGVARVLADTNLAQNLISTRSVVNTVCLILIIVLMGVSVFIISNTIRLATYARREEIGIMRIVGATKRFIRLPFMIEGAILGLVGAFIAFLLQMNVYSFITDQIISGLGGVMSIQSMPFSDILWPVLGVFILAGFLIGVGGSTVTIRRFLKV